MSSEATLRISLQIRKDNFNYQSGPTGFTADIDEGIGPAPGVLLIDEDGTVPDFSTLPNPRFCWLFNLSETVTVHYGSLLLGTFCPLFKLSPGCGTVVEISDYYGEEMGTGTGTGPSGIDVPALMLKAVGGTAYVRVEATNG